jgi:predicted amidohydrolase
MKKQKTKKKSVIAIAAIQYFDLHKKNNVRKITEYIAKAKRRGADIVCFPEMGITKKEILTMDHPLVREIGEACRRNGIWCIVNDHFRIGKHVYNTAVLFDRQGKVHGHYRKINLYGDNTKAGREVKVFRTDFGKIGIVVCWDLTYPGLFNEMRRKGAEIVFCPARWFYDLPSHKHSHMKKEIALLRAMVLARAHENVFYVGLCNPVLPDKDQVSYSAIADPHNILKEILHKEGIITAKVDLNLIKKFRKFYGKH